MLAKKQVATEVEKVGQVAALLGKSDFEVFTFAYQAWYAEVPGMAQIDYHYAPYLSEGEVPFWVRSYVSDILDQHHRDVRPLRRRDWPVRFFSSL